MDVQGLIEIIRQRLADPQEGRWADKLLLSLLNNGLQDLNVECRFPKKSGWSPVPPDSAILNFSKIFKQIDRVVFEGNTLSMVSSEEAYKLDPAWESKTTDEPNFTHVVYDLYNEGIFQLYPGLGNFDYTKVDASKIQSEIFETTQNLMPPFIRVFGVARISELRFDQEWPYDEFITSMIIRYVVGMALRVSTDVQDRMTAQEELQIFERDKMRLKKVWSNNSSGKVRLTSYKGFI